MYSIPHYVIKLVSDLWQVDAWFSQGTLVSFTNKSDATIKLKFCWKQALSTITPTLLVLQPCGNKILSNLVVCLDLFLSSFTFVLNVLLDIGLLHFFTLHSVVTRPHIIDMTALFWGIAWNPKPFLTTPKIYSEGQLSNKRYNKWNEFNWFPIVNILYKCTKISAAFIYGVHISQLIRYSRWYHPHSSKFFGTDMVY